MAAAIHDDDLVMSHQRANLQSPIIRVRKAAMHQEHGLAVAELGVPDADAVDRRPAALVRRRQLRRRRQNGPWFSGLRGTCNQRERQNERANCQHESPRGRLTTVPQLYPQDHHLVAGRGPLARTNWTLWSGSNGWARSTKGEFS